MGDHNDPFMRNQNSAVQGRGKAQGRANVLQLKLIGQSHPTGLTANLLKMFEPRPPLDYKPPPEKRKCPPYSGMAQFVSHFAEPGDPEYAPPVPTVETPAEKKARIHKLRLEKGTEKAAEELKKYDPNNDPNVSGDPYKTLFVAKLSYETSESRLKREFESYGPIKRVCLVHDSVSQKPRGYAFIEYMHTRDMKAAYKQGDGRKIDGRRVLVDVERGRTVPNWRPRRLGGGLGTSRVGVVGEDVSQRNPGREQVQSGAPSRSEEPRAREDRPDREKSRERGRGGGDREREKSRERGGGGDREQRDKSRERGGGGGDREQRDKSRERGGGGGGDREQRDKSRERSHERGTTTRDRDHRGEDRHHRDRRERGHDRDRAPRDRDHRRHRDRDRDYDVDRDRDYEHSRHSGRDHRGGYEEGEDEGELLYQQQPDHHGGYEHRGRYDYPDEPDESRHYDRATSRDMDQD